MDRNGRGYDHDVEFIRGIAEGATAGMYTADLGIIQGIVGTNRDCQVKIIGRDRYRGPDGEVDAAQQNHHHEQRQRSEEEPVAELIEDPWKTIRCPEGPELCVVEFEDPTFSKLGRDLLYYVRAIQEPTPTVNGGGLRCGGGDCKPCYGNFRTPAEDDCLVDAEERAWSSPIYLRAGSER